MDSPRRILCKMCKGSNDPRNAFCEYCGASLREQGYKESGRRAAGPLLARSFKRLVFVVVIVAVLGGVYYGVDRFLLPAIHADAPEATVTTRPLVQSTTTTTTIPRVDKVIAGESRYATALALSRLGFAAGVEGLVLAGGDSYAEALCAVPLAAAYGGPVLLVPEEGIADELAAEIERLAPATVFLVDVSRPSRRTSELKEILDDPTVKVLGGDSVYETAAIIAEELKGKTGEVDKVVIVPSDSHAEGLAVAPLAAVRGWPILLKPQDDDVPKATVRAIEALGAPSVLLVGTKAELDIEAVETRVGEDVYDTCAAVAVYAAEHGLSFEHTALVSGEDFPDGLVAGPYLARDRGILLLTKRAALPDPIQAVFADREKDILRLDFIGLRDLAKEMQKPGSSTSTTGSAGGLSGRTTTSAAAVNGLSPD